GSGVESNSKCVFLGGVEFESGVESEVGAKSWWNPGYGVESRWNPGSGVEFESNPGSSQNSGPNPGGIRGMGSSPGGIRGLGSSPSPNLFFWPRGGVQAPTRPQAWPGGRALVQVAVRVLDQIPDVAATPEPNYGTNQNSGG